MTAPSSNWKAMRLTMKKGERRGGDAGAKRTSGGPPSTTDRKRRKIAAAEVLESTAASTATTAATATASSSKDAKSASGSASASAAAPSKIINADKLWFADDVPLEDLKSAYGPSTVVSASKVAPSASRPNASLSLLMDATKIGKYVAIDCEMVGVGPEGTESALARVSIVNFHGSTVLDLFVKPKEAVTDYRTFVSGITPQLIKDHGVSFELAQTQVAHILKNRILVGHSVNHDLKALLLSHPKSDTRDTARFMPHKRVTRGRTPGLKRLAKQLLGITVQEGEHSSVEDAKVTMELYKRGKKVWEVRRWQGRRHTGRKGGADQAASE